MTSEIAALATLALDLMWFFAIEDTYYRERRPLFRVRRVTVFSLHFSCGAVIGRDTLK